MTRCIPTEAIGSIPRPTELLDAYEAHTRGELSEEELEEVALRATIDTIRRLDETGSSCVGDGEQRKFSGFASYCLHGCSNIASDGVEIPFSDGHSRHLPTLTQGPFRYALRASSFLEITKQNTTSPIKQSVIAPSLLSLVYPNTGIADYPRWQFQRDLLEQHTSEVRECLDAGAYKVQLDFTEGRFSLKIDPSGGLLESMVELINKGLEGFSDDERQRIGVHTCPGSDLDATHSADIDYKELLPTLFGIDVGSYYIAMASEEDPERALRLIKTLLRPAIRVFVGVIDPIDPRIETAEEVKERVLRAARFIPVEQLGTTDDCGFAPFMDDRTTSRETAFAKIRARVEGTRMAEAVLLGTA